MTFHPGDFLRDHWQKRPLLVRNAFPGFVSPITPEILSAREFKDGTMELLDRLEPGSALGATLGPVKAVISVPTELREPQAWLAHQEMPA